MSGSQMPPGSGADPSMEDILASIRRILVEDDAPPPAKPPVPPSKPAPALARPPLPAEPPEDDVLVLDTSMLVRDASRIAAAAMAKAQVPPVTPVDEPPVPLMAELPERSFREAADLAAPAFFEPVTHSASAEAFSATGDEDDTAVLKAVPLAAPSWPAEMEPLDTACPELTPSGSMPAPIEVASTMVPTPSTAKQAAPKPRAAPPAPRGRGRAGWKGNASPLSDAPEPAPVPADNMESHANNPAMTTMFPSPAIGAPETIEAAASSVGDLVRALPSDRGALVHSGGPTIADLVREEMRPMLKSWLDANLAPLVERLVRAEIDRVIARATL